MLIIFNLYVIISASKIVIKRSRESGAIPLSFDNFPIKSMSQFEHPLDTVYVDNMRHFLNESKYQFLLKFGFTTVDRDKRGRLPKYLSDAIQSVEKAFNEKAKIAEKSESIGQRIELSISYFKDNIDESAQRLGVTTMTLKQWLENLSIPTLAEKEKMAHALNVPQEWLETGDTVYLPANSTLGVRVGQEALDYRQILKAMTMNIINEIYKEKVDNAFAQAFIEWKVFNTPEIAQVARKAGGRWQICTPKYINDSNFVFAPWVPLPELELKRRLWSNDVENIIDEELRFGKNQSIYEAYNKMEKRFKETSEYFPQRVSLYKRIEKINHNIIKFGANINNEINQAIYINFIGKNNIAK